MNRKLVHPWWSHLPAVIALVGFVVYSLIAAGSWPARMPLSTSWSGEPRAWGSPWIGFGLVVGLGLVFIAVSAVMDELWARQEGRKRFNAFALLDEAIVGWLCGTQLATIIAVSRGATTFRYPWEAALIAAAVAALAAAVAEWRRPFIPAPNIPIEAPPEAFARAIAERVRRGERIVYWDVQNPRYVSLLALGVPAILWIGAGLSVGEVPWIGALLAAFGLPIMLFYGGLRTRVTNEELTVRYGIAGIRVFRCAIDDIESIRLRRFAALREFGGYGIRFSGSTVGYFLAGSRGVEIGRSSKRSALIGSDHPRRLAAVVAAVSGNEVADSDERKEGG
jgi:hypothetical protein